MEEQKKILILREKVYMEFFSLKNISKCYRRVFGIFEKVRN